MHVYIFGVGVVLNVARIQVKLLYQVSYVMCISDQNGFVFLESKLKLPGLNASEAVAHTHTHCKPHTDVQHVNVRSLVKTREPQVLPDNTIRTYMIVYVQMYMYTYRYRFSE